MRACPSGTGIPIMLMAMGLATHAPAQNPGEFPSLPPALFQARDGLPNVLAKLAAGKEVHVAYLGASVTAGGGETFGWRALTFDWFKQTYPNATLVQIHDPTGGTCSDLGVARLGQEVLDKRPDLLFVEFAVNDLSMPYPRCLDTIEGIVRQTRRHDPAVDIVFIQVLNQDALKTYRTGKCPHTVAAQETVADRYGISSINVGWHMAQKLIAAGDGWKTLWKECYADGVHPGPAGYRIYADHVIACLEMLPRNLPARPHALPAMPRPALQAGLPAPLSPTNWEDARLVSLAACELGGGWGPETNPYLLKRFGQRFPDLRLATEPGQTVRFAFEGTAFGLYTVIGKDGGILDVELDGKPRRAVRFINPYSLTDWRVDYAMVKEGLAPGRHEVLLRVSGTRPEESAGTAVRLAGIILRGQLVQPGTGGMERIRE